jgi:aminocarboxymuconate-semialdehyde decarboxylase
MPEHRTIDAHAHILAEETMAFMRKEAPKIGPRMERIDDDFAVLEVGGIRYQPFPRGGWDMLRRLSDMDAAGIDMQLVSNTPQTFLYNQDPSLTAAMAALQNDQIAKAVAANPKRLMGLATLAMQAPALAAEELRRAIHSLGLKGAQIGSYVNGRNLDDPKLGPLWAAANELGAFIMVHPTQVAGAERLGAYYLTNLIGNPLDTTIMLANLMLSGALDELPDLRLCLAHGGGFTPYQIGRLAHGHGVRPEAREHTQTSPRTLLSRLYFDSLVFDPQALRHLIDLVGADHVCIGTDAPFDMADMRPVDTIAAVPRLTAEEREQISCGTALRLLGEAPPAH